MNMLGNQVTEHDLLKKNCSSVTDTPRGVQIINWSLGEFQKWNTTR